MSDTDADTDRSRDVDGRVPAAAAADLRLVPAAASAWAAAALGLRMPTGVGFAVTAGLAVAAAAVLLAARRTARPPARRAGRPPGARSARRAAGRAVGRLLVLAAALACAAAAAGGAVLRVDSIRSGPLPVLAQDARSGPATLVLTGDPDRTRPMVAPGRPPVTLFLIRARAHEVIARGEVFVTRVPVLLLARDEGWADLLPGQRVRASGRWAPARPGQDVAAVLRVDGAPELLGRPGPVARAAGVLRAGLRTAVAGLPPPQAGLVPGLVVGDTSRLPPQTEDDFRTTGLTHLTAVSGANCAIVMGFVLLTARWAGVRGRLLPVLGALALLGFLVLARPQPSVLRATVMGLVAVLALASGRRRLGIPALAAAVLVLVLVDPWLAVSYGFVLSVLATTGLLLLAPRWTDRLAGWMPRPLAAALAVPAAAQAVCAPVVVLLSSQVSLVAVLANLLVAPAVAPTTVLGVLAAVTAPVDGGLASVFGWCAGLPAWVIVTVARTLAAVPLAAVDWPGTPTGALVLALFTVVAVRLLPRILRRPHLAAALCVAAVAAAVPVVVLRPVWPPSGWVLVVCDVGQGDALVLATGTDAAVVFDAGPEPEPVDRCLRDLEVDRVSSLVLSHAHADHVEGVPGVLRGRQVDEVVIGTLDDPPEQSARVARWARDAEVPVRRAGPGPPQRTGDASWQVVSPAHPITDGSASNNSSLVVVAERAGVRLLLTGDVEPEAQRALLRVLDADGDGDVDAGPVDVLKIPHHGSANQLPALFRLVAARLAVVSAGRDNTYGHPATSALELARVGGAVVGRTDTDGDLAVVGPADRLRLVRRGS